MAPLQLSDPRKYTVGIITALDKELAAAMAVLDEKHRKPQKFKKHPKDTNTYTWGKIGEHNVVIASLAAGSYGTVSAATTALSMISSLPHIRFGLMVGIGAGVPRLEDKIDIRLGDVVVSQPTGTSPGVVQYDLGKLKKDGKFERVGHLSAPPEVLLKGLQALKAEHLMEDSQIPTILEDMVQRYPKMKEPGENGASGFIHQGIENDRACAHCDSTKEIKRKDRSPKPAIHYGVIASGNSVIKDGVSRDEVLQRLEERCICFEMEAAGLMNNFPCLVIRGICDYADAHKNDRWQNYAAATAAAFAKELLNTIDGDDVESTPSIEEAIQHLSQEVAQIVESSRQTRSVVQSLETNHHVQELRRWLSPPNPSENYNNGIKHRYGDSGQWFLQSREYSLWKSRPNSFLWLQGIPGCGKTVLSSIIVKDLEDNNVKNALYFFFDFTNRDKRLFDKALGSLVLQLYCKNENTQKPLDSLYDFCGKGITRPSADQLFETFQNMLQHAGEIHVILDALDECQTRKEHPKGGLLTSIEALATSQQTNIHLLVTARPEQDITSSFESWARSQDIVPLQSGRVAGDILAYVKARVRIQNEIEKRLLKEANGMFRWVTCQLDALENCLDYATLQKALNSLPTTLDETYARILTNLRREHEHHARRLLQFLAFSERPLTIEEAVDAMAVDIDTANSPRFDPKNRMPVPKEIINYCSSLVVLTVKTTVKARGNGEAIQELQLAHLSVKDYLLSNRVPQSFAKDFDEATARASIAQVCLAYVLELDKSFAVEKLRQSYWLAQYSARYWMDHAVMVESSSKQVCALMAEFFSCEGAQTKCYGLYNPDDPEKQRTKRPRRYDISSALYYASLGGSCFSVRLLLDKNANVHYEFGQYRTALNAATHNGHDKVVQMLLEKNAGINIRTKIYFNALHAASSRGYDKIVRILLNNGADVNARGGIYTTALQAAAGGGHDKVVQILLDYNANINAQGMFDGTALWVASYRGHDKIVQILLDNNANVNAKDAYHSNALQGAAQGGHVNIVQMLLDNNVNVNAKSKRRGDALSAASYEGHVQIVQILLDNNANVNAQGGFYDNALQAAALQGHDKTVQLLLDNNANVNTQGGHCGNALQAAAIHGHDTTVQLLLDNGANVNAQGGYCGNALQAAASVGHDKIVQLLLDKGANVNAQGGHYGTALKAALSRGHDKIAQMLRGKGARDESEETA
ncbi:ankyrin repeats (3 copies) domain-containing protein [Trichoderma breve]|uniref:Ankyrin repeats (3 copies) domain-containing protein n=1 Tax=Trichoderma breve TaxID=2034170 RepID=A0A9W9B3W0_9HYPO|nr:ankyrin repeats (3 copies) domain-containing protein [Trichoderma breve]KAJ4855535.1 ankyrin repeats (3 copies) domain-containing protein [Trichoderma breve]